MWRDFLATVACLAILILLCALIVAVGAEVGR